MNQNENTPLTDKDDILDALDNVSVGDELTVEDESDYRDNREVTVVERKYITFGEPGTGTCRLLNRNRATTHKLPTQPEQSVSVNGYTITKLWVW